MRRLLIGGLAGYSGLATASIVEHFTYHMPEFDRPLFCLVALGIYGAADAFGLIPGPYERTMSDLLHGDRQDRSAE